MYTLIMGFDAFDPDIFERLMASGSVPNLARYADRGGYARFEVANPPQSEVSWTSIATGLGPGGHGIFDFVHRDPKSYIPYVSLLPTQRGLGGFKFVRPSSAATIFEHAARKGYPATSLWWPATFPARPEMPINTIPGLGTPDILGKLGVGTLFTTENDFTGDGMKTAVDRLVSTGYSRYKGNLRGPARQKGGEANTPAVPFEIEVANDEQARIKIGQRAIDLVPGKWSPIIELSFNMGMLVKIGAVTRFILRSMRPHVMLYTLPLQIHPLHSPWPYASPPGFVRRIWGSHGPFLTLGWPQDTTGLEDGCITDEQFLDLCDSIFARRSQILLDSLPNFHEGLLASVFDTLDRVQHMFLRDRPDVVEKWYIKLDELVGKVEVKLRERGEKQPRILIVSDHGFKRFDFKVHLNRWLIDKHYLAPAGPGKDGKLRDVDWSRSQAYAIGLNSLYFNISGREGQGVLSEEAIEPLRSRLRKELLAWEGPDGKPVVKSVISREEGLIGRLAEHGPDLIIGYSPGYRASAQTGLGEWTEHSIELNRDHWGADHCIDASSVPGVIFSSQGLKNHPSPSYRDIPVITIDEDLPSGGGAPPPSFSEEDQEILEERMKSLGYL